MSQTALPSLTRTSKLFAPIAITLDTNPPVNIIIGRNSSGYYWRYDYTGCKPMGAYFNYQAALKDAYQYSTNLNNAN